MSNRTSHRQAWMLRGVVLRRSRCMLIACEGPPGTLSSASAGRQVDINTEVGVVHDIRLQELRLYTDYGRCCRPLFIVDKQALRIKKSHIQALQGVEGLEKLHWHVRPPYAPLY